MELIIYLVLCVIVGFIIGKLLLITNNKNSIKPYFQKVGDKQFIIGNEFVDLETDTPVTRMEQQREDNRHYWNYEKNKLIRDRDIIYKDYIKTTAAIYEYPKLKECVTNEKLEAITEKYDKYEYMCKKLDETIYLSKEEFLIKEENPMYCIDFTTLFTLNKPFYGYTIHNEKTAKYANGDMNKMIAEEFKEKWY